MKSRFVCVAALGLTLVAALLVLLTATAASATSVTASDTVKVMVDARAADALKQLPALGGQLLQDYGAFSVWVVPGNQATTLANRSGVTLRPDFDVIGLREGAIDTRAGESAVPSQLRETAGQGPQFWMVQFAGPIKTEWLTQLQQAGLEVVMYMPNNAYVVWGKAPADRLAALATRNSMIQWTGAYHPAYRLSPKLNEAAGKAASNGLRPASARYITAPSE